MYSLPASAQEGRLGQLYADLLEADASEAQRLASEIELEWQRSGSAAMDILHKRGNDAMAMGDWNLAVEHLTALTDHAPDFADGWHSRAIAYARLGQYGPAIADLEHALAIEPRHYNAIISLGSVLEELGRPQMARDAYQEVLAIHPHHEDVTNAVKRLDVELGGSDL